MSKATPAAVVPTGVDGLDSVLRGGIPRGRLHLVQGKAGTGKTTLGLQFALAGVRAGESCLYVTLAETETEVRSIAASHGWAVDGLEVLYHTPVGVTGSETQTVLHPAEIELPATIDSLLERVKSVRPDRLVIDSLSELRILAREPRWFRNQLLRLRARLEELGCTALLLDTGDGYPEAENLLGGVLQLERHAPAYGPDRRRLHVVKMRGHAYQTGYHDARIRAGGLSVYPRLIAAHYRHSFEPRTLSSGLSELDRMLGGGLDQGTAILLLGPTGSGKSTLACQCAVAAAERGERVLAYVFDERLQTVLQRNQALGIDLKTHVDSGRVAIRQVDPAELTPGEFAVEVRREVEEKQVEMVVIDSLNAYLYAMPDERLLHLHLHELLAYLSQRGVTSILVATQHGLTDSANAPAGIDVSYLADTVLLLKTFERGGRVMKALTVFKRRAGEHEDTVRELRFALGKISIGDAIPLSELPSDLWAPGASAREEKVGERER